MAVLKNIFHRICHYVHVCLCINPSWYGEPDQFQGRKMVFARFLVAACGNNASFHGPHPGVYV